MEERKAPHHWMLRFAAAPEEEIGLYLYGASEVDDPLGNCTRVVSPCREAAMHLFEMFDRHLLAWLQRQRAENPEGPPAWSRATDGKAVMTAVHVAVAIGAGRTISAFARDTEGWKDWARRWDGLDIEATIEKAVSGKGP